MSQQTIHTPDKKPQYLNAAGQLPHPLTNDYMFKALLQKNENVLKHLICSLLHLYPEEVESVEIKNPIVLGEALTEDFDSKIFVLDINVLLNSQALINLEMQVINYGNWLERALIYMCRNFDQLCRGDDYINVKTTIHIGFLDFTLFPKNPEFYSLNMMMNVKTCEIFSDKLVLRVVDLNQIELATPKDREWKTDYWASLFKATTWEELKMLADKSPILGNAVETIYELTADESIREQCKAREKHVREMNTVLREREMAEKARDAAFQERDDAFQERDDAFQERDDAFQERDDAIQERDDAFQERDDAFQERDDAFQERDAAFQERDAAFQERDNAFQRLDEAELARNEVVQRLNETVRQMEQLMEENKRLKEQQNQTPIG